MPQLSQNRPSLRCSLAFSKTFSNVHRQSKLASLAIFFSRKQPATLGILQNKLITVQRQIREPCSIEERCPCDRSNWKTEKRPFLTQSTYFRCGKVSGSVLEIEKSRLPKCHAESQLNMTISNLGKFQAIRFSLRLAWQSLIYDTWLKVKF